MAPRGKAELLLTALSLQCSVSCGVGVRKRSVTCRGERGSLLHTAACSLEDRPPLTEPCVHEDCPLLSDQAWHVGTWGLVSALHPHTCCLTLVSGRWLHPSTVLGPDTRHWAPSPASLHVGPRPQPRPQRLSLFHPWASVLQELQLGHSEATGRLCHWAAQPLREPAALQACGCGAL